MKHRFKRNLASAIVTGLLLSAGASQATASNLTSYANGTVYDSDLNVTWLADAGASGSKTWIEAMSWAANLTVAGVQGWRLPTTLEGDSGCSIARADTGAYGVGCSGSEMGHLFYVEGVKAATPTPFANLSGGLYWSGTTITNTPGGAYIFEFGSGFTSGDWYNTALRRFLAFKLFQSTVTWRWPCMMATSTWLQCQNPRPTQ